MALDVVLHLLGGGPVDLDGDVFLSTTYFVTDLSSSLNFIRWSSAEFVVVEKKIIPG